MNSPKIKSGDIEVIEESLRKFFELVKFIFYVSLFKILLKIESLI